MGNIPCMERICFLALEVVSTLVEFTFTFLFSNLQNSLSVFLV